jgi:ATP-dependent exoDNAse (exonuclease V) alpha subunit
LIHWSGQQEAVLAAVSNWLKERSGPQVFRLFGWAGTGKSTLATHLAQGLKKVRYAAFTGKAALVMRRRGCTGAQTIHSLIYKLDDEPERGGQPSFILDPMSPARDADLIVVDEVSMVNEELGRDLLSFGAKVLVLGDPFQLPPVQGTGFFTSAEPDIMLTEIHRQAADNPIIRMSMDIREGRGLDYGTYDKSKVIRYREVDQQEVLEADTIIVGKNKTRNEYNARLRELLGLPENVPVVGDKILCLRNNREKRLLNGQLWIIRQTKDKGRGQYEMHLEPEDEVGAGHDALVTTHIDFFTGAADRWSWQDKRRFDEFCFGYALTGHKSQGSQWPNVYLFDQSSAFREDRDRWLYTAVTRAADRITVVA